MFDSICFHLQCSNSNICDVDVFYFKCYIISNAMRLVHIHSKLLHIIFIISRCWYQVHGQHSKLQLLEEQYCCWYEEKNHCLQFYYRKIRKFINCMSIFKYKIISTLINIECNSTEYYIDIYVLVSSVNYIHTKYIQKIHTQIRTQNTYTKYIHNIYIYIYLINKKNVYLFSPSPHKEDKL